MLFIFKLWNIADVDFETTVALRDQYQARCSDRKRYNSNSTQCPINRDEGHQKQLFLLILIVFIRRINGFSQKWWLRTNSRDCLWWYPLLIRAFVDRGHHPSMFHIYFTAAAHQYRSHHETMKLIAEASDTKVVDHARWSSPGAQASDLWELGSGKNKGGSRGGVNSYCLHWWSQGCAGDFGWLRVSWYVLLLWTWN